MKNNQKGRSMIEMLGVLSIAGILSMSGISLYSKALYQRKISNTIDQVSELMTNMRNAFRSRREYSLPEDSHKGNCSNDKRGLIPDSMKRIDKEGCTMYSAIGTSVMIVDTKNAGIAELQKSFTIMLNDNNTNIDNNACAKIATSDWGKGVSIIINKGAALEAPVKIEKVVEFCQRNKSNSIWFVVE